MLFVILNPKLGKITLFWIWTVKFLDCPNTGTVLLGISREGGGHQPWYSQVYSGSLLVWLMVVLRGLKGKVGGGIIGKEVVKKRRVLKEGRG